MPVSPVFMSKNGEASPINNAPASSMKGSGAAITIRAVTPQNPPRRAPSSGIGRSADAAAWPVDLVAEQDSAAPESG